MKATEIIIYTHINQLTIIILCNLIHYRVSRVKYLDLRL